LLVLLHYVHAVLFMLFAILQKVVLFFEDFIWGGWRCPT